MINYRQNYRNQKGIDSCAESKHKRYANLRNITCNENTYGTDEDIVHIFIILQRL